MTESYDDKIRKNIIQKFEDDKKLEEFIKDDLVKLQDWWDVECKVNAEKQRILKENYHELRHQRKRKEIELRDLYGTKNVEKVKSKYNIRL